MHTTIKLLDEADAMQRLGMRSHGGTYMRCKAWNARGNRLGDRRATSNLHVRGWDTGVLLAAYVMFERDAQTERRVKEINQAWRFRYDIPWRG